MLISLTWQRVSLTGGVDLDYNTWGFKQGWLGGESVSPTAMTTWGQIHDGDGSDDGNASIYTLTLPTGPDG